MVLLLGYFYKGRWLGRARSIAPSTVPSFCFENEIPVELTVC
jgi:hypothetical protein